MSALLLAACSPIRGCMESQFTLAPDSRLPKWFSLPDGYSRNDVTVEISYYSSPFPVDDTVVKLLDRNQRDLAQVTGESCFHPIMQKKRNQYGGFDPDTYPHYAYIKSNKVIEVVEHMQGPTFRIVDDPMLLKEAVEAKQCDNG